MEGARAIGGATVGSAAGSVGIDVQGAHGVTGAVAGGIRGAVISFRGRVREGEGRIWAVDLVGEGDALPLLENLSMSDRE